MTDGTKKTGGKFAALKAGAAKLGLGFRARAHETVTTSDTAASEAAIISLSKLSAPNHAYRDASNLSQKSDQYSPKWQENIEGANVLYGALASISRMTSGNTKPELAAELHTHLKSIASTDLNGLTLAQKGHVVRIADTLLNAEKSGQKDIAPLITAQDVQILTVAMNVLDAEVKDLAVSATEARAEKTAERDALQTQLDGLNSSISGKLKEGRANKTIVGAFLKATTSKFAPLTKHDAKVAEVTTALKEINEEIGHNVDYATLADNMKEANQYIRALAPDVANKLNAANGTKILFDVTATKLDPDVEELGAAAILNKPTGDALEAAGFLTSDQVDQSGQVQALMIAIRDKAEADPAFNANAVKTIGEMGSGSNAINFFKMLGKSDADLTMIKTTLAITDADVTAGRKVVEDARAGRGSVNDGKNIEVPGMGQIHKARFADSIEGFKAMDQGFLIAQRGIEALRAYNRIQLGAHDADAYDADLGAQRGFRTFPNDQNPLKRAVKLAETINIAERTLQDGHTAALSPDTLPSIASTMQSSSQYFIGAGQVGLAQIAEDMRAGILGETPQNIAEIVANAPAP